MKYLNVCEYITKCVVEYFVTMINDYNTRKHNNLLATLDQCYEISTTTTCTSEPIGEQHVIPLTILTSFLFENILYTRHVFEKSEPKVILNPILNNTILICSKRNHSYQLAQKYNMFAINLRYNLRAILFISKCGMLYDVFDAILNG